MGDLPPILKATDSSWNMPAEPAPPGAEPVAPAAVRPWRRYREGLGAVICQRVAAGESLSQICRGPGMPCREAVRAWRRERPAFGAALAEALALGRRRADGGGPDTYCPHVAGLICERLAMGMSLRQAVALDGLPAETTVYGWLRRHEAFREAYGQARVLQAHRRFDQVWEIAESADRDGAYLAKVRIDAARWQASRLAPKRYGVRAELAEAGEQRAEPAPPEPPEPPEAEAEVEMMNIILKSYRPDVPDRLVRFPIDKA